MPAALAAALVIASSLPAPAGGQVTTRNVRRDFDLSAGQVFGSGGEVFLIVTTSIDYRRLVFFRKPSAYEAEYRLYLDIRDEEGERVLGDVHVEKVLEPDYASTVESRGTADTRRTIPIEPGDYEVRAKIEVSGTSLEYERRIRIRVYGRDQESLEIADAVLSVPGPDGENPPPPGELPWSFCRKAVPTGFSPLAGRSFASFSGWLRISVTVYTPTMNRASDEVLFSIRVRGPKGGTAAYNRQRIRADDSGSVMLCFDLDPGALAPGRYTIDASASIPNSSKKAVRETDVIFVLVPSMLGEYFEETVDMLSWIADDEDLEELRSAPRERRDEEWRNFWDAFEPEPSTRLEEGEAELLRRLEFAMKDLGGAVEGWRTDMGRIYITYGAPDLDEERDGPVLGSRYRLWYYYSLGAVFIFEDPSGSGSFRLKETRSI